MNAANKVGAGATDPNLGGLSNQCPDGQPMNLDGTCPPPKSGGGGGGGGGGSPPVNNPPANNNTNITTTSGFPTWAKWLLAITAVAGVSYALWAWYQGRQDNTYLLATEKKRKKGKKRR